MQSERITKGEDPRGTFWPGFFFGFVLCAILEMSSWLNFPMVPCNRCDLQSAEKRWLARHDSKATAT